MKYLFLTLFIFPSLHAFARSPGSLKLWYTKPAGSVWTDALPARNVRLGVMVCGDIKPLILPAAAISSVRLR